MYTLKTKENHVQAASLQNWMTFVMDLLRFAMQDCMPSHDAWLKISQERVPVIALCKKKILANLGIADILVPSKDLLDL